MITLSKSLQLAFSTDPLSDEAEALDYYRGFSAKSKGSLKFVQDGCYHALSSNGLTAQNLLN